MPLKVADVGAGAGGETTPTDAFEPPVPPEQPATQLTLKPPLVEPITVPPLSTIWVFWLPLV
jgi:hypothetical protein